MLYLASKLAFIPRATHTAVFASSSSPLRIWHNFEWTHSPTPDEMAQTKEPLIK
jgi:hypothetical protein